MLKSITLLLIFSLFALSFPAGSRALTSTQANLKVAFIGDSGQGNNFKSVLTLIKNEGASALMHAGDFDYESNPNSFEAAINSVLGSSFPYFATVGNHDIEDAPVWNTTCGNSKGCYGANFMKRWNALGIPVTATQINSQMYTIEFKGLKFFVVGNDDFSGLGDRTFAPYLEQELSKDTHTWKICSWHRNQGAMQVGDKGDSMGWGIYDTCQKYGAIVATAHEHTYHRTKTLTSIRNQTVDPANNNPNVLRVEPGKTFVFVSGLGGSSMRPQVRCLPSTYPYGCKGEWAKIYTTDQGAKYGALFITFNVDGDPNKAKGYFKNIAGEVIDQFDITTTGSTTVPTTGPTAVPTPRPSTTPTPRPSSTPTVRPSTTPTPRPATPIAGPTCATDINLDGKTDLSDYAIFVRDFLKTSISNGRSDINKDGRVDLSDYAVFVRNFLKACSGTATPRPSSTPTPRPSASIAPQNPGGSPRPSATPTQTVSAGRLFSATRSPFNQKIPSNAIYTQDTTIATFRQTMTEWSMPLYRTSITSPLVTVTNTSSGRTAQWPIPTSAQPAAEADAHLAVLHKNNNRIYEMWEAAWSGTTRINAGGMVEFPLDGTGISNPPHYRVTAAGFAISAGSVIREDFINPATGQIDPNRSIEHALAMALPTSKISSAYVAPAVGPETKGQGNTPMGALFALRRDTPVDSLNVHPVTKAIARAARDYGIYINDGNGTPPFNGKHVGNIRFEPGLTKEVFGIENDQLIGTIENQIADIISQYGIYRVTGIDFSYAK